ncbi:MAG: hypothetical protein GY775_13810 [Candidatus Scalindua sp.]|nr:hypothetical protein [Candidatus Scalindua sp.]
MDTYKDKLAPWEEKNTYYNDVKLGMRVKDLKITLKDKTDEMIAAQIDSADEIVAGQDIPEDLLQEIDYDMKSVGQGMSGLRAAFEWGISDVVWFLEKGTGEMRDIMENLKTNKSREMIKEKAEGAYARGVMDDALENFIELELFDKDMKSFVDDDFSLCISLGMIYLFHKIDKKEALDYFDKAVRFAMPLSAYYTSYALLYKALINRDFGLIEEAEKCTSDAIDLSPGLTEAMYQNAQYNAILNRPEKAIPMLKKVIREDIVYCLKISCEQDFKQISSGIAELFEEIRNEKNEKVKEALEEAKKNVIKFTTVSKGIKKLGHDVPEESSVELLEEGNNEIDMLVENNSILDAHYAGILFPLLSNKFTQQKELIRRKGNEVYIELDRQIQELSAGVSGKKKKGGALPFLLHFLCGQIVALPFGFFIGVPLGICISEGLLIAICFYINVIQPQSQWKDISEKQNEKDKIERVLKKL